MPASSNVREELPRAESFRRSPELREHLVERRVLIVVGGVALVATGWLWTAIWQANDWGDDSPVAVWLSAGLTSLTAFVVALWLVARYSAAERDFRDRLDADSRSFARAELDEVAVRGPEELLSLLDANRAVLDEYQRPVRSQARSSYRFAQIAASAGVLVLIAGFAATLAVGDSSARIGLAGLTAVGTGVAGFVARTFLRVYEKAQDQLNFYFREPLITSYFLTAERLAGKLSTDRREDAYAEMVSKIVHAAGSDIERREVASAIDSV